jgi:hypothetical protein
VVTPAERAKAKPKPETTILRAPMKVPKSTRTMALKTKKATEKALISLGADVFLLSIIADSMEHAMLFKFHTQTYNVTVSESAPRTPGIQLALATKKEPVDTSRGYLNNCLGLGWTLGRCHL